MAVKDHHLLEELDRRQDEVLAELDSLNSRVEKLLAELTGQGLAPTPAGAGQDFQLRPAA